MRFVAAFTTTVVLFAAFEFGKKIGAGKMWRTMTDLWDSVEE